MSSSAPGNTTFAIEITDIGVQGIRMLRRNEELFLSYRDFPWFKNQPKRKIENVTEVSPEHFYWPEIDVDLCLDSIRHPDKFPLKAKT
jgi:hypothetical protein